MRRGRLVAALLLTALLCTGCGSAPMTSEESTDSPEISTENVENSVETVETFKKTAGKDTEGSLHVTVESVEISVSDLAAQAYTVPVQVVLDSNPGITYSEWGLAIEAPAAAVNTSTEGIEFQTVAAVAEDGSAIWTAWSSGLELMTDPGTLLIVEIKLPEDAKPGDSYVLHYLETAPAGKPHTWSDGTNDWAQGSSWEDGTITIVE